MNDVVIPIVFPDYLIAVATPPVTVEVPDFLPFIDILPNSVRVPATKHKVGELGHAGVLFFNGATGLSKYHEYGRYDQANLGLTRRVPIPDVDVGTQQKFHASLTRVLSTISIKAGHRTRISGAYIEVPGRFKAMLDAAAARVKQNRDPKREPYSLTSNSCLHYMMEVMEAAGVDTPYLIDPRPNSYIEEIRDDHRALDYNPGSRKLVIAK